MSHAQVFFFEMSGDALDRLYNSVNNYDTGFDRTSSTGRNYGGGNSSDFDGFSTNHDRNNDFGTTTYGNQRTTHKIQNPTQGGDSNRHDEQDGSLFTGSMSGKKTRRRKVVNTDCYIDDDTATTTMGSTSTTTIRKKQVPKKNIITSSKKKQHKKAPKKKRRGTKRKRDEEDDDDSHSESSDSSSDKLSPIHEQSSDSNLEALNTRMEDEDLDVAYGTRTDEEREFLRQALENSSHGDFRRFVQDRRKETQQKPAEVEHIITTRTKQTRISLDQMQCDLVYHKKKIHDMMNSSIKKTKTSTNQSEQEIGKKSLQALVREEIGNHSNHCNKYISLLSVLPKAPRSRGMDIIFGAIETEEEKRALRTKCTCNPTIIEEGQFNDSMSNNRSVINIPEVTHDEEATSSSTSGQSGTQNIGQATNNTPANVSTNTTDNTQPLQIAGYSPSQPDHPDLNAILDSNKTVGENSPFVNLSRVSPQLLSYVQSEFGELMDLAHMDVSTFLSKTCPLCLYGGYSAKGSIYMEAVEQIKAVYRTKAFSSDHSTLAIKLCSIWNTQVFLPLIKKGVQILPCLYEVILDHIKRPHIIDATLVAKSEVDDITSMQMGLKQLIFYKVKIVEEEKIPAERANTNIDPNARDEIEEGDRQENINESESSSASSSSSDSADASIESDSVPTSSNGRTVTRITESTRYNPAAMRDYVMLSRLKLSWLHSKRTDTVFNAQGRTKRKDVFNPHNSNTTIRL